MNAIKSKVKQLSLVTGLYRPARYVSDILTNSAARKSAKLDKLFFKAHLPKRALCFDVGANIGEKSYAMLSAGAKVIAFEPIPFCAKELKARCKTFGDDFAAVEAALDLDVGTKVINVNRTSPYLSSFTEGWAGSMEEIEVQTTTLDLAIRTYGLPFFCKIDVEGWELQVLKGLSEPMPMISFEYHLSIEPGVDEAFKCLDYLAKLSGGKCTINVSSSAELKFKYDVWKTIEDFKNGFPSDVSGNPEFDFGDIWVRTDIT